MRAPSITALLRFLAKTVVRNTVLFLSLAVLTAAAFSSCDSRPPLQVVTDIPEVIEYAEYLRSSTDTSDFSLRFIREPDRAIALGEISADVIISHNIAHEGFSGFLHPIPLVQLRSAAKSLDDGFALQDMYPESYEPFVEDNSVRVMPLAFDIPIVYLSDPLLRAIGERDSIDYRSLLTTAAEFNRRSRDNYSEMGFSSLRNIRFIELLLNDLTGIRGGLPDEETLGAALVELVNLLNESGQEPDAQLYYNQVFAYAPDHSVIESGRLHASFGSLSGRSAAHESLIARLPFVWLTSSDGLELQSPGIYAGVSRQSSQRMRSIHFIRELLSAQNQAGFMSERPYGDIEAFLNRLSTNRIINENVFPERNTGLVLPGETELIFPGVPVELWDRVRREALHPWLEDFLAGVSPGPAELNRAVENFYRLNGGYN